MSDKIEGIPPQMSEADFELTQELEAWQNKVKELRAVYTLLKQENTQAKKKHSEMQQKLAITTATLEANTRLFGELYEESKTALQMGRDSYLNSTISVKTSTPKDENVRISPKRTTSVVSSSNSVKVPNLQVAQPVVTRRKIENLEPMQLQFDDLEDEEQISEADEVNSTRLLSVIEEENTNASIRTSPIRRAYVRITQLPFDILEKHLHNSANGDSSLEASSGEDSMLSPTSFSKVEHMRRLGLSPTDRLSNRFSRVTVRRRGGKSGSDAASSSRGSKRSVKSEEDELKREGRSTRKARPQGFKEPSLREKLRR